MDRSASIAFYDGKLLPADRVAIPYWDIGFAQGVSIVEQLRTYGSRLPLVDQHLSRLQRGLTHLDLPIDETIETIRDNIGRVVEHNHALLPAGSDLGICVVASAGWVRSFAPATTHLRDASRPIVLVHSFPLPFERWKGEFSRGVRLATTGVREVSEESIPHAFKHRNRLHYYLAQQEVDRRSPGCRPLLATHDGFVADSTTAGILVYRSSTGWLAPLKEQALQSVTVEVVEALAQAAQIGFTRRAIQFSELATADEVMLCSTPTGVLPVVEFDGQPIGDGTEGPHAKKMSQLWSQRVNWDYRRQALEA
jgi:branched-chain amino acid aminotransferase